MTIFMTKIYIKKFNETYIKIETESGICQEIQEFFTFDVPGAKFSPKYKAKLWDGKIRLFNLRNHLLYLGLLDSLYSFAEMYDYEVEEVEDVLTPENYNRDKIVEWINSLNLHARGVPITVHEYQIDAVIEYITNKRRLLLSPTASGKSLIIYLAIRWMMLMKKQCLIIVPDIDLSKQIFADFSDYSSANGWDVGKHCHVLYGGQSKTWEQPILISTWQSIYKNSVEWFSQFDCVVGDECHLYKAGSIVGILEKSINAEYRLGTTGTLDKSKTNKMVLEGLFGKVYTVTTTKELMDMGKVSQLKIKCIQLRYPDDICKVVSKYKYDNEYDYVIQYMRRNKFICNLLLSLDGTSLLLVDLVEKHAKIIVQMLQEMAPDRKIYNGFGNASIQEIKESIKDDVNPIIVASFKKLSTGKNIPQIKNIVFGAPSKSVIQVLQSIGRGLRLDTDKDYCTLFDIIDDLHWKSKRNTILNHGTERIKMYREQKFDFEIFEYKL